jgi:hypothetical protein
VARRLGSTLLRVVETGIRPVIDIVMIHREPGRGMIGFGLTSPPMACFEQAAEAFYARAVDFPSKCEIYRTA